MWDEVFRNRQVKHCNNYAVEEVQYKKQEMFHEFCIRVVCNPFCPLVMAIDFCEKYGQV